MERKKGSGVTLRPVSLLDWVIVAFPRACLLRLRLPAGVHRRAPCHWSARLPSAPSSACVAPPAAGAMETTRRTRLCSAWPRRRLLIGGVLASGLEGVGSTRARAALRLPGLQTVDGPAGRGADGLRGAGHRVDRRRRGGAAVVGLAVPAGRHPAVGDPIRALDPRLLPPSGPTRSSTRWLGLTRCLRSTARRPTSRRRPGGSSEPRRYARPSPAAAWCGCSEPPAASASRAAAGVVAPGLVVTNAHVVAGESEPPRCRSAG